MARRSRHTKRSTKRASKVKLFSRIYSPLHHALMATRNVSRALFSASGAVVDKGLEVVDKTGSAIASHANMAVRNVTKRSNRKNRKNTRKNRK